MELQNQQNYLETNQEDIQSKIGCLPSTLGPQEYANTRNVDEPCTDYAEQKDEDFAPNICLAVEPQNHMQSWLEA